MTRKGIVVGYNNNDYYRENIFLTDKPVIVKNVIREAYPIGKEVEIIKQSDDIKKQEDDTYYCVNAEQGEKSSGNSYKTTCYPGPGNTDVDLNNGNQKGQKYFDWLSGIISRK